MGWRRLAHPRTPARAGRPAEPAGPDRPGAEGRPALDGADPLVGGVAVVPDGGRPGRSRGLRHPRDRAGDPQAVPGHLQVDQGADVRRGPLGGRQGRGVRRRAAAVPAAGHQREDRRRRRAAEGAHLHAAGRPGRAAREGRRAVGDQRHVLDHLPQPARAVPGRGARDHRQADPRDRVADGQLGLGPDGVGVGLGRPDAARALELRRARPPRLREEPRRRRSAGRFATSTRSSTTRSARSSRARGPTTSSCSSRTTGSSRSRARSTWTTC